MTTGSVPEAASRSIGRMRLLLVVNKDLPPSDYRILYARRSAVADVALMMPHGPAVPANLTHVETTLGEGVAAGDVAAFARMFLYLRRNRHRYDLVHFFSSKAVLLGPMIARRAGVRSVVTVTGLGRVYDDSRLRYRVLRPLYRFLLRRAMSTAERVLFQNRGHLEWFQREFPVYAAKFQFIGSCMAAPRTAAPAPDFGAPVLRVLCVSRLLPQKGIDDFLEVALRLASRPFEFVLVGPPARGHDSVLQRVREAAARGVVTYRGELRGKALWQEYTRSHVLLFPSHGEGLPRVMLEAGLAGLCPVAYDIPAHRDLVGAGQGYLARYRSVDDLIAHLEELEQDRAAGRARAREFAAAVRRNYDPDRFIARSDELYASLSGSSPGDGDPQQFQMSSIATLRLREATHEDLDTIVDLHHRAFPGFLMVQLGKRFLRQYHQLVLDYAGGFTLLAERDGLAVGYITCFVEPSAFHRRLQDRRWRVGMSLLPALLKRPWLLNRVRGSVQRSGNAAAGANDGDCCEIASVGVMPHARGTGVGERLMHRAREAALARGALRISLTTDADANEAVNRWYQSLGLRRVDTLVQPGARRLHVYSWDLSRGNG